MRGGVNEQRSDGVIKIKKAHHSSYAVADLEKSKDFYGRVLGLESIDRPDFKFPGAWYAIGPYQIHLIAADKDAPDSGTDAPKGRTTHMALEVEDVEPVKQRLSEVGIAFREGEIILTNMRQVFCRDPDGYGVEFIALKK